MQNQDLTQAILWAKIGLFISVLLSIFFLVQFFAVITLRWLFPTLTWGEVAVFSGMAVSLILMVLMVCLADYLTNGHKSVLVGKGTFDGKIFVKGLIFWCVFVLLGELMGMWLDKSPLEAMALLMKGDLLWAWAILVVVLVPIYEEFLFRGLILGGLIRQRLLLSCQRQRLLAGVISSALFALVHWQYDWFGMLMVFVLSLLLAWVRLRSGSLLMAMWLHGVNNLTAMTMLWLA